VRHGHGRIVDDSLILRKAGRGITVLDMDPLASQGGVVEEGGGAKRPSEHIRANIGAVSVEVGPARPAGMLLRYSSKSLGGATSSHDRERGSGRQEDTHMKAMRLWYAASVSPTLVSHPSSRLTIPSVLNFETRPLRILVVGAHRRAAWRSSHAQSPGWRRTTARSPSESSASASRRLAWVTPWRPMPSCKTWLPLPPGASRPRPGCGTRCKRPGNA